MATVKITFRAQEGLVRIPKTVDGAPAGKGYIGPYLYNLVDPDQLQTVIGKRLIEVCNLQLREKLNKNSSIERLQCPQRYLEKGRIASLSIFDKED